MLLFCIIAFLQTIYYLFFFSRIAFYRKPNPGHLQPHPVSVIVCARDEAHNLAVNLPGILVQQYPFTHEVLVVNDNSYDDSKYVLEEFQQIFPQLRILELNQEETEQSIPERIACFCKQNYSFFVGNDQA